MPLQNNRVSVGRLSEILLSLYQRGKSWYYDFKYRGERYTGCVGAVSKTVAKEILAKKKAEAVEGRYELPSKKPTPKLEEFAKEYFAYYRANRRPRSAERHETSYRAMSPTFGHMRLSDITPFAAHIWPSTPVRDFTSGH